MSKIRIFGPVRAAPQPNRVRRKRIDQSEQRCYNKGTGGAKDIKHLTATKQETNMEQHLALPYNKYGEWVDGTWMPYDDMEESV